MARLGLALLLFAVPLQAAERAKSPTPAPRSSPSTPLKLTLPPPLPATVIPTGAPAPAAAQTVPAHVPQARGAPVAASLRHSLSQPLAAAGASAKALEALGGALRNSYPEDPKRTYHNRDYAEETALLAADLLEQDRASSLSGRRRATVLLAALLHAADPSRETGALPRMPAIQDHLSRDPEIAAALKAFQEELGVNPAQVRALALAMSYAATTQGAERTRNQFLEAAAKAFPREDLPFAQAWGAHLAFAAKAAPLLGTPIRVEDRLKLLAAESRRTASVALGREVDSPSDESMLASGWRLAKPLRESPSFALLPESLSSGLGLNLSYLEISNQAARQPRKTPPQERGPPQSAAPISAHPSVKQAVEALASMPPERLPKQPSGQAFRSFAGRILPHVQANVILTTQGRLRAQELYKDALQRASQGVLKRHGLKDGQVLSHGTDLKGLLGMLYTGSIVSTNRYAGGGRGFSGEGFHMWAAEGTESGAGYGAARGTHRRQPGVTIILHNAIKPLTVSGDQLSRQPLVDQDFLAAVISDGSWTVVLDRPALAAMSLSALRWQLDAVAAVKQGRSADFRAWEQMGDALDPNSQADAIPRVEIGEDDIK